MPRLSTPEWRSRIGFGGLLFTGILGVVYSLSVDGREWLWLVVLFGLVTTIGIAGFLDSNRYTAWTFLTTGALAVLSAGGRTLVYQAIEPLAILLLLLGIAALYRGNQYRQAV